MGVSPLQGGDDGDGEGVCRLLRRMFGTGIECANYTVRFTFSVLVRYVHGMLIRDIYMYVGLIHQPSRRLYAIRVHVHVSVPLVPAGT